MNQAFLKNLFLPSFLPCIIATNTMRVCLSASVGKLVVK